MAETERQRPTHRRRAAFPTPSLEDIQHWTWVMGRAQQMMMEHLAQQMGEAAEKPRRRAGGRQAQAALAPGRG